MVILLLSDCWRGSGESSWRPPGPPPFCPCGPPPGMGKQYRTDGGVAPSGPGAGRGQDSGCQPPRGTQSTVPQRSWSRSTGSGHWRSSCQSGTDTVESQAIDQVGDGASRWLRSGGLRSLTETSGDWFYIRVRYQPPFYSVMARSRADLDLAIARWPVATSTGSVAAYLAMVSARSFP